METQICQIKSKPEQLQKSDPNFTVFSSNARKYKMKAVFSDCYELWLDKSLINFNNK